MNVYRKLVADGLKDKRVISFGEAVTVDELQQIFKLRYHVYSDLGYINPDRFPNQLESDEYDTLRKSRYFIAILEDGENRKMIGCIRLIIDDPLPTELDFEFEEPNDIKIIPRNQRAELGRFIIIPPDKEHNDYLPRGFTMLFLLNVLSQYGIKHNIQGGYAFIKRSLDLKLRKSKFPTGYIKSYTQRYPKNGILHRYFSQPEDPVIPIYFVTRLFYEYTEKIINMHYMFEIKEDTIIYKRNLYTWLLRSLKIT